MTALKSLVGFLARFTVIGLALAFLVILWKPQLLRPATAPSGTIPTATLPANGTGTPSYAAAVARSAAAVVNVSTRRVRRVERPALPPQLEGLLGENWPRYRQRVESSLGSGVIIDIQGHIVTNYHVVESAQVITVELADNRTAEARVVGSDPDTDLAILRIDLEDLPTMPLGRSDTLQVGDVVLAIGNPVGLNQTVTHGIVSAKGRGQLDVATFEDFIQTDAAINVGNSGGALVNTEGELVGINTAVFSRNAGIEGIGFAIPVNLVRGVMGEIFRNGRVIRGWLGIAPENISARDARSLGLPPGTTVLVLNVYVPGPAYDAGIRPGDAITHIDEAAITSAQEALARVAQMSPGTQVRIRGLRSGQPFDREVTVVERPKLVGRRTQ
jgi:serine protease DegS